MGDEFRLLIVTSTRRNARSTNIADYDTHVQNAVAAGHTDIRSYSSQFKVVGCTAAVDARDHTATTGNGVPIYWLNGNKVADNYGDFYDGSWDEEATGRNQSGGSVSFGSSNNYRVFTGCDDDGTELIAGDSKALGKNPALLGRPNESGRAGPIDGNLTRSNDQTAPFYALSPVFVVRAAGAPSQPYNLRATVDSGRITLTWDDPGDSTITGYQWRKRGTSNWLGWSNIASSGATTTTFTRTGLTNGVKQCHQIRSRKGSTYSRPSAEVCATPNARAAKPSGFSAAAVAGKLEVALSWSNPGDSSITRYEVRRQKAGASAWGNWRRITGSGAATTAHTETGLAGGTAYDFELRAVNSAGEGPAAQASATTVPAAPGNLRATPGNAQIVLAWTNPGDSTIDKYQTQRKRGSDAWGSWVDISGSGKDTTSQAYHGLTNGVEYRYRLRAKNENGDGPHSEVRATPNPAPAKTAGLTAAAGHGAVTLAWTDPNNATIEKHQYRRKAAGGSYGGWQNIPSSADGEANEAGYTVTRLTNGVEYTFEVRAVNPTGPGPESDEESATPTPAVPTGLTATALA